MTNIQSIVNHFFELKGWDNEDKSFYETNNITYRRFVKPAKELLVLCDNDLERAKECLDKVSKWANDNGLEYSLGTAIKKWLEMSNI